MRLRLRPTSLMRTAMVYCPFRMDKQQSRTQFTKVTIAIAVNDLWTMKKLSVTPTICTGQGSNYPSCFVRLDMEDTKMEPWFQMVATIVCAVVASSGFWAYIQKRSEKKDVRTQMLIGLAHDRIIYSGMSYIERGWITQDEYENLHDYLYKPYEKMGGNGSAKKVMREINKLPIRKSTYIQENQ